MKERNVSIIFNTELAAAEILRKEGRQVMDIRSPESQRCNPARICILNLLPEKPKAETQWLRGLSYAGCDVEVTFFMVESYQPKHTSHEYLEKYYKTLSEMKNEYYDGLIITGADAENYEFEDVVYWEELQQIFDWADSHVNAAYYSCWASLAASYHYYGIGKELLGKKISGIYPHRMLHPDHMLMKDIAEPVYIPHSRISRTEEAKVFANPNLTVLAESECHWPVLYCDDAKKAVFIVGHWEYEPFVLQEQYIRDTSKGYRVNKPENYYASDGSIRTDLEWPASFHLMMRNWVQYYARG